MNIETKIEKLRGRVNLDPIQAVNFFRLVDGDLSDIGDALVEGKEVITKSSQRRAHYFTFDREDYEIVNPRVTIGEVSFPAPEKVAPAEGTTFWLPYVFSSGSPLVAADRWAGGQRQRDWLERGLVHLTAEAAIEHAKALIRLSGGDV